MHFNDFPPLLVLAILLWSGLGVIGWLNLLSKNSHKPARAIGMGCFSIPHAIIFGPFFLFISLAAESMQICPFCQSEIPAAATVCGKCTRDLPPKKHEL